MPQQEEGKDWITPEGSFPLSSIWALVILHLLLAFCTLTVRQFIKHDIHSLRWEVAYVSRVNNSLLLPSFSAGVWKAGEHQCRLKSSDWGAKAAEAAAGLHAQPAPADVHRPSPEPPDARGWAKSFHPAHPGEHLTTPQPHLHHHLIRIHVHSSASRRRTSDSRSCPVPQSLMIAQSVI